MHLDVDLKQKTQSALQALGGGGGSSCKRRGQPRRKVKGSVRGGPKVMDRNMPGKKRQNNKGEQSCG